MKIKPDFILRQVAGNAIVVAVGEASQNFNGIINLNETGAFLWEKLQNDTDEKALIAALLSEYEVDEVLAAADVAAFIEKLREADLLDD